MFDGFVKKLFGENYKCKRDNKNLSYVCSARMSRGCFFSFYYPSWTKTSWIYSLFKLMTPE